MTISEARSKFFKKNPSVLANFCKNEKLNKTICFTYDYVDQSANAGAISDEIKSKILSFSKGKSLDAFSCVLEYFTLNGIDNDLLEKIADLYYECSLNGKSFNNTNEVCDEINNFITTNNQKTNSSNSSLVCAYEVLENGELGDRVFYMDITHKTNRNNQKVCKIENTFTEESFRGAGLHSYAIRFLEAVLAKNNIFALVGEAMECDAYQSKSTLNEHYKNLGFEVTTGSSGTSYLYKSVDPYSAMSLTSEDLQK
ncbi:MAG: hypothetical protein IJW36_03230 [Clostridia bacterium]|nr:hypothetical protein [Clostridia bacterium]